MRANLLQLAAAACAAAALLAVPASSATASGGFAEPVGVLVTIRGDAQNVNFGWAVSELSDVDADGVTDIITSDPFRVGGGAAYVYSGSTGDRLFEWVVPGTNYFGYSVADAGDTSGDGVSDVLVGDALGDGAVELHSGADGSLLHRFAGAAPGDGLGTAVSTAGDVDHDGRADILIGAGRVDTAVGIDAGVAYVYSGRDYHRIRTLRGEDAGGRFGSAADLAADLDGDGLADLLLGARDSGPFKNGRAYAFSAATGRRLWTVTASKKGGELGSFFVGGLGDVDRDGTADVYLGDYLDQTNGGQAGAAFVVSGVDGSRIHAWYGAEPKEGMGPGREAGDLDRDGVQDLAVGSYLSSSAVKGGGRLDIFSGATGRRLAAVRSTTPGENFGFDAVGLGDTNADGRPDIVVSAATGNAVYIISGTLVP